jgi:hypothetical protein
MSTLTPIFGKPLPTDSPTTLGSAIAPLITSAQLELMVNLVAIEGEVNAFLLFWDDDCGWEPLATLVCNDRRDPPLAGKNRFLVDIPSQRYIALWFPQPKAAEVSGVCFNMMSGGAPAGFNTFWNPWTPDTTTPPIVPEPQNQEFDTPNIVGADYLGTWLQGGLNRGGASFIAPPDQVNYSLADRPSWLLMQPTAQPAGLLAVSWALGMVSPLNWFMHSLVSIETDASSAAAGDSNVLYFMGRSAAGNWDITAEWVGIQGSTLITGEMSWDFVYFDGLGTTVVNTYVDPGLLSSVQKLELHKVGNLYRAFLGTVGGNRVFLGSVSRPTANPDRYGYSIGNSDTPNMILGSDYIRHIFRQVVTL